MEYLYDIIVRRQYSFANIADAINSAHGTYGKVSSRAGYAQIMGDVKNDIRFNDEYAVNYLVSYAVNIFVLPSPGQLRNSVPPQQRRSSGLIRI